MMYVDVECADRGESITKRQGHAARWSPNTGQVHVALCSGSDRPRLCVFHTFELLLLLSGDVTV